VRVLDLYSCAGGATMGMIQAWPEAHVTGVDIKWQKNYCGHDFIQGDALAVARRIGRKFDFIWASPPCQAYTRLKNIRGNGHLHPQLIEATRNILCSIGVPWVIENVEDAPLINPVILCGTMFPELRVYRHRKFECSWGTPPPAGICNHTFAMGPSRGAYHRLDESEFITCCGHNFQAKSGKVALQIEWMTRDEMAQAVPPAYSRYIAEQYSQSLVVAAGAAHNL